jgi:hypothetical protein
MEVIMSGKKAFIGFAIVTALGLGAPPVAFAQDVSGAGSVNPCSLAGINPADHPEIFGNPEVARSQYGFVRGPDGNWTVIPGCNIRR